MLKKFFVLLKLFCIAQGRSTYVAVSSNMTDLLKHLIIITKNNQVIKDK